MKRTTTRVSGSPVHPTPRSERFWLRLMAAYLWVSLRSSPEHTRRLYASNRTAWNAGAGGVVAAGAFFLLAFNAFGMKNAPSQQAPVIMPVQPPNNNPPSKFTGKTSIQAKAAGKISTQAKATTGKALGQANAQGELAAPCQIKPGSGPEMVLIAAGEFMQGSPDNEVGRSSDETPQHKVIIQQPFALSRCEVTVGEFRRFIELTGYKTDAESKEGCYLWDQKASNWEKKPGSSWTHPGFAQKDNDPVVCVSWNDAKAYVKWLNGYLELPDKPYRLPSESEWEYAARAGTSSAFFWGGDSQCDYANGADATMKDSKIFSAGWNYAGCSDGFVYTAPVGSFKANAWGLYDMSGNAWEWVEDCWHENYQNSPANGSAWLEADKGDCAKRSVRGGSWNSDTPNLRSAIRNRLTADGANNIQGFRLARTL